MSTATEIAQEAREREREERSLHATMERFIERWTAEIPPDARPEFHADLLILIQAVHRDASRETHALLRNTLAVMPPVQFIKKDL